MICIFFSVHVSLRKRALQVRIMKRIFLSVKEIKELIATLKKVNPYVEGNIFKSVENVNLDTVVAYKLKGMKHHFLDTYDLKEEI